MAVDEYRAKAAELAARAKLEADPAARMELETLARSYLRLAEQAAKNAATDILYETPSADRPAAPQQQQQQIRTDKPESDSS